MITDELSSLYQQYTGTKPTSIVQLPGSGSQRTYYRLFGFNTTVIGAVNYDIAENKAFFSFTNHFRKMGLPVPELLMVSGNMEMYLLEDLGDTNLFQVLQEKQEMTGLNEDVKQLYKQVLNILPEFQITAAKDLDFSVCYPRQAFDLQSMKWDLNYFKYYFLRLAGVPFSEQALEDDFNKLCGHLLEAGVQNFLYRDFQSRNIMINNGKPWFIDYQGGRKGALQYDVASLLYDAKADLKPETRAYFLGLYLNQVEKQYQVDPQRFLFYYPGFILIRILQALGAYGFRGYFEKKEHFLKSIPYALDNLRLLRNEPFSPDLPELFKTIDQMTDPDGQYYKYLLKISGSNAKTRSGNEESKALLTIRINSFSYRRGIPEDETGNGGGFVFDCRALPNPGRFEIYRSKTGKDKEVIDFLKDDHSVLMFNEQVSTMVDQSIRNYSARGFQNLMVSFGCTGGRHRSVYCAEQLAAFLAGKSGIRLIVRHMEQEAG
jgi:aminoglycoside/choline kinase family phosphotransferase